MPRADAEEQWRKSVAKRIGNAIPKTVCAVFDADDAYGVALCAMLRNSSSSREYQYRCGVNAVNDQLRSVAGWHGEKTTVPLNCPEATVPPSEEEVTDLGPHFVAQVTDPEQRKVLELLFLEQWSMSEVAKLMNTSKTTVWRIAQRGLKEVADALEREGVTCL